MDIEATYFNAIGKGFDLAISMEKTADLISKQIGIDLKSGALIEDSYLYRLAEGSQVKDNIANLVLQNVSAKSSFKDLKAGLQTLVEGDETTNGAMQQYLRTYAYDTFSNVQRAVDLNIADTYQFNSFIYSGDIIKDSREFCIERVNGVFTRADLEDWSTQDWAGKNWDVPVEISLGGYNCRHTLMWIPDEAVEYFKEGGEFVDEGGKVNVMADDALKDYTKFSEGVAAELKMQEDILLQITNDKSLSGYAVPNLNADINGRFGFKNVIRINPLISSQEIKDTIRHEMRHIKQSQVGDYYKALNSKGEKWHYWKDKPIISQDDFQKIERLKQKSNDNAWNTYLNYPWEKDARNFAEQ